MDEVSVSPLSFKPIQRIPVSAVNTPGKVISFGTVSVFGKGFSKHVSNSECIVIKMLNGNVLDMDGRLDKTDTEAFKALKKEHLWIYIYYLWLHNYRMIGLFERMTRFVKGIPRACANCFVKEIQQFMTQNGFLITSDSSEVLTREQLIDFIDTLFTYNDYKDRIKIPLLTRIYESVLRFQDKYIKDTEEEIQALNKEIADLEADEDQNALETDDNNVYVLEAADAGTIRSKKFLIKPKDRSSKPVAIKIDLKANMLDDF